MDAPFHPTSWQDLRAPLEQNLAAFLAAQRWFGGKTRVITRIAIADFVPVPLDGAAAAVTLVRVTYEDGGSETYLAPLIERFAAPNGESGAPAGASQAPSLSIPVPGGGERVFSDALWDRDFLVRIFEAFAAARTFPGSAGEIACLPTPSLETLRRAAPGPLEPSVMKTEQSNTSVLYGRSLVLKFFRHLEEGVNPDFEIGEFLSVRAGFRHVPPAAGALEYRRPGSPAATIGILQGFVRNRGDAWQQTLAALASFYDRLAGGAPAPPREPHERGLLAGAHCPCQYGTSALVKVFPPPLVQVRVSTSAARFGDGAATALGFRAPAGAATVCRGQLSSVPLPDVTHTPVGPAERTLLGATPYPTMVRARTRTKYARLMFYRGFPSRIQPDIAGVPRRNQWRSWSTAKVAVWTTSRWRSTGLVSKTWLGHEIEIRLSGTHGRDQLAVRLTVRPAHPVWARGQVRLRLPMRRDPSLTGHVPSSAWLT